VTGEDADDTEAEGSAWAEEEEEEEEEEGLLSERPWRPLSPEEAAAACRASCVMPLPCDPEEAVSGLSGPALFFSAAGGPGSVSVFKNNA
jgi:hypothetical protein